MISQLRFCTAACLLVASTLATAQVLTKSDTGLTTPEFIQVLAHSSDGVAVANLSSLSAQDVNGDGRPDLLVTGPDPSRNTTVLTTTLLRNTGGQNFTQIMGSNSSYCLPAYTYPSLPNQVTPFCTLADLNGDGLLDKIFAGEYPNASNLFEVDYPYIKVEYATGPGTWAAPVKYGLGGRNLYIASVATGDFNGDGRTDIAVLRVSQIPTGSPAAVAGFVFVLWGKADGTFTVSNSFPTNVFNYAPDGVTDLNPDMQILSQDFNGDGKSDLLAFSGRFGSSSILLGTSNGLSVQPGLGPLASTSTSLIAVDLNKDGLADVVVQESSSIDANRRLHVLSGGGRGSQFFGWFSRDQVLSLNEYQAGVIGMESGDFNGDGRPDIAVATTANLDIYVQNADGSFTNPRQYALPSSANAYLVMADFNGDGKLDLAIGGNPLAIFYGDGHGSFSGSAVTSNFYANAIFGSGDVVSADFNKDGKPDVATTFGSACDQGVCSSSVNVFMGSGQGWFQPQKNYTVPASAAIIAAGDVNGDGFQDLITLNTFGNNPAGDQDVGVLLGKSGGTFGTGKSYKLGVGGLDLFVRDVNRDGKLDLITDAGVALGNGDGSFGSVIPFAYPSISGCVVCQSIAVGDFNRDGKLDVLFTQQGVHVLLGDGTGHFTEKTAYSPPCTSFCQTPIVTVADLNGDGKLDFVAGVAAGFGGGIIVYLGNGDGTFSVLESDSIAPSANSIYGMQIVGLTIHDMNGDGIPDIIAGTTNGLAVFLGKGGGHLSAPMVFGSPAGSFGSSAFAIDDFDSKGTPDIIMPTFNGIARLLNTGYATWPKVSSLAAPSPYRTGP